LEHVRCGAAARLQRTTNSSFIIVSHWSHSASHNEEIACSESGLTYFFSLVVTLQREADNMG